MTQQLEQTEGLDLKKWLNNNNLSQLHPKFEKASLSLQDLLSNKEDALRELFDYIGCNPVEKIKLITALKSIPTAAVNKTKEIVFLTQREQEIMHELDKKNTMISDNIKQIQDAINGLEKSCIGCNKEIHDACNVIISSVEKYRKLLLDNVQNMKSKRKNELEIQLNNLKVWNKNVMKAVNACKQIASGDVDDKYDKMKQVIDKNETEKKVDIDINTLDTTNIKLEVKRDDKLFKSGLEQALFVKFADDGYELKSNEMQPEILKFSKQYSSSGGGFNFSDDMKCVTKTNESHKNILADITPVTNGVHCWRVQVKNQPRNWIMFGVAEKKIFNGGSGWNDTASVTAFQADNWFSSNCKNNGINTNHFKAGDCEIDILLDIDKKTLNACVVGNCVEGKEVKMYELTIGKKNGLVPFLNFYYSKQAFKLAKIPISWYGKQKHNIFK